MYYLGKLGLEVTKLEGFANPPELAIRLWDSKQLSRGTWNYYYLDKETGREFGLEVRENQIWAHARHTLFTGGTEMPLLHVHQFMLFYEDVLEDLEKAKLNFRAGGMGLVDENITVERPVMTMTPGGQWLDTGERSQVPMKLGGAWSSRPSVFNLLGIAKPLDAVTLYFPEYKHTGMFGFYLEVDTLAELAKRVGYRLVEADDDWPFKHLELV